MESRTISAFIKEQAVKYVEGLPKGPWRGDFDGDEAQRIMGHIGMLMVKDYLGVAEVEMDTTRDGPDLYDFNLEGKAYDVKTSYSWIYAVRGTPPADWGILVPLSQFEYKTHEFYIRCVVDGRDYEQMTRCGFLCACTRADMMAAPVKEIAVRTPSFNGVRPFKVVAPSNTIPVCSLRPKDRQLRLT